MKIYTICKPALEFKEIEDFLHNEKTLWRRTEGANSAEELIELSGRLCYFSFGESQSPRSNGEYIRNLIENGHESVLEHSVWSFIVTGISRAFSHQLVRHRAGFSFSQLSQQYHDEGNASFVLPYGLEDREDILEKWSAVTNEMLTAYRKIQVALIGSRKLETIPKEELRAIRSISRSVLPNATETKIAVTANTRALRNFIKTRGRTIGDLEMRKFCCQLLAEMKGHCPAAFYDLNVVECLDDELPIVSWNGDR